MLLILDLMGFSSIGNLLSCIKFAKYNELTKEDIIADGAD